MLGGKIGPLELVLILAVVLLIFGPGKLPSLAKAIGQSVTELKDGLRGKSKKQAAPEAPGEKQEINDQ
ncbi:MAG: twin-arginine translocase TatA/TatE family subunit [Firmicutes bacterium]|nr:twin-arginine translocase TatA/TatE family subunit [Bacillota bacterium]